MSISGGACGTTASKVDKPGADVDRVKQVGGTCISGGLVVTHVHQRWGVRDHSQQGGQARGGREQCDAGGACVLAVGWWVGQAGGGLLELNLVPEECGALPGSTTTQLLRHTRMLTHMPHPQELLELNLVPEEWGGNTPMIPVSAKKGNGMQVRACGACVLAACVLALELAAPASRP